MGPRGRKLKKCQKMSKSVTKILGPLGLRVKKMEHILSKPDFAFEIKDVPERCRLRAATRNCTVAAAKKTVVPTWSAAGRLRRLSEAAARNLEHLTTYL
jgi:hypothetical protein